MKRYQELNWLGKLWRMRHYLRVPFMWLRWKILHSRTDAFNGKTAWHLFIGTVQSDMNYYWTAEEAEEMLKKYEQ